jgi:hypothetical protein
MGRLVSRFVIGSHQRRGTRLGRLAGKMATVGRPITHPPYLHYTYLAVTRMPMEGPTGERQLAKEGRCEGTSSSPAT